MQMINFCILIWLINKFLVKPVSNYLETRRNQIQTNIESAEQDKEESQNCLNEQKETLHKAAIVHY